jgi:hypothetical protein
MRARSTPDILSVPARAIDAPVFSPDACIPGTEAFAVAMVTVDDHLIPDICPGTELEAEHGMPLSMGGGRS